MSKDDGWLPIKRTRWQSFKRWVFREKDSYSVTYKDVGVTPGTRLRLTRSVPFKPAEYTVVTKVNGDNSLEIVGEDGKKKTISFT